jgi:hypothetical protein
MKGAARSDWPQDGQKTAPSGIRVPQVWQNMNLSLTGYATEYANSRPIVPFSRKP